MASAHSDVGHLEGTGLTNEKLDNTGRTSQLTLKCLFAVSILALSWMGMMLVHELGHVVGGVVTGGSVRRVILHPLAISRTDVSPNPSPGIVVWLGPLIGVLLPFVIASVVKNRRTLLATCVRFFSGFCFVTNGAYIGIGSFEHIGDCREMHVTGTPQWVMLAFCAVTVPLGFFVWHRVGSIQQFFARATDIPARATLTAVAATALLAAVESLLA